MQSPMENEPMVELFVLETNQLIEQLEMIIIQCEKKTDINTNDINSIFRIIHTIKGSSLMMVFNNISKLSHSIEDLFFYIREHKEKKCDFTNIYNLVLDYIDYIKGEVSKLEKGEFPDGDCAIIMESSKSILKDLESSSNNEDDGSSLVDYNQIAFDGSNFESEENCYCLNVVFNQDAEMENVRSHLLLYSLRNIISKTFSTFPENIDLEESAKTIKSDGFFASFSSSASKEEIETIISANLSIQSFKVISASKPPKDIKILFDERPARNLENKPSQIRQQNYISVHSDKLNLLMDLVGELVITEAMVTKNPDLNGLNLKNFDKSARLLGILINELRDAVVDMRMLPVSVVFQKMHRIIRDMSKELNKDIELNISGEDISVDKSIIDILPEPIMHLIRNAVDHGIENKVEREMAKKPAIGRISLKAWQNSEYVFIEVSDDGRGINKEEIYKKATANGLISKSFDDLTDKEIFAHIFFAGFSTKDDVTEFSGRGVGMDVVKKSIDLIGGNTTIESELGKGTTIIIRIPLTLLIVNVINVSVGNASLAVPIRSITEIKRVNKDDVVLSQDGNEMIMIREICYPIIRLQKLFDIKTDISSLEDGVLLLVEGYNKAACLFVDKIASEQQIVVKPLPNYIKKIKGISGCSIQNDGSLSLILDMNELLSFMGE